MQSCDAFAMYFLGFGKADGTVFMSGGQLKSVYDEIIPLFSATNLPSLSAKPKLFVFHLAEIGETLVLVIELPANVVPCWK